MITKIELGSFNRDASSPIFLKEKIESDGSLSIRIYQRKDIDSINSFKDKIKTMVKYGIEDFCMAHQIFRPLLGTVGVKRIDHLQTDDLQNAPDLFQSIRSEARIGNVTEEKEIKLKKILGNHGLSDDYKIDFYEGKYKDADFFSDLKKFIDSDNKFSKKEKFFLKNIHHSFTSKAVLTKNGVKNCEKLIKKIKDSLDTHFQNQTCVLKARAENSTNPSENIFSLSNLSHLKKLQTEIKGKLDEIENEIKQRSITPTDEDIKNHLFSLIEYAVGDSEDSGTWAGSEAQKKAAEIRPTIDILFSTSWRISEEKKLESLETVQGFFKDIKKLIPEAVINRIYPEQETAIVSPPGDQHLDTNRYADINQ